MRLIDKLNTPEFKEAVQKRSDYRIDGHGDYTEEEDIAWTIGWHDGWDSREDKAEVIK